MRNLLLSSVTLLLVPAVAFASSEVNSHTHTTPIELKPISSPSGIKLAGICFLGTGDCGSGDFDKGDSGYQIDSAQQCINEGYELTSCPEGSYPQHICPYNPDYFLQCGSPTPEQKCENEGYSLNCENGMSLDSSQTCPYNSNYKKCVCTNCSEYPFSLEEASITGYEPDGSCNSCGTITYKRKNAECLGYFNCECGGEIGAKSCKSGSQTLYDKCKECPTCDDTCIGSKNKSELSCQADQVIKTSLTECGSTCYSCCSPRCNIEDGDGIGKCGSGRYVSSYDYNGPIYTQVSKTYHWGENYGYNSCGDVCWKCYPGQLYEYMTKVECRSSDNIFWSARLSYGAKCIMSDGVETFHDPDWGGSYGGKSWSSKENCEAEVKKLEKYINIEEAVGGCKPTWTGSRISKEYTSERDITAKTELSKLPRY